MIFNSVPHPDLGLQPGWTRKDIEQLPNFFSTGRNAKLVIYRGSAQVEMALCVIHSRSHSDIINIMSGVLPGWTRKDIKNNCPFFLQLWVEMLNMLYILEALRHNNVMSGFLPGWTRKDIEQLPKFYSAIGGNVKHVIYPRSTQITLNKCHVRTSTWMNQKGYRTTA